MKTYNIKFNHFKLDTPAILKQAPIVKESSPYVSKAST